MSIQTIIEQLLDEMARPDLESLCKSKVPEAIRAAHSSRKFTKDLREVTLLDPAVTEHNRVRFNISSDIPRLRDVKEIKLYKGYTPLPEDEYHLFDEIGIMHGQEFKNRNVVGVKDYYGIHYPHLFSKIGGELLLQGIDPSTKAIHMMILSWPTVTVNEITQDMETDSFIVDEWPEVIKAYLRRDLAVIVQKNQFTQIANGLLQSTRMDMINDESEEYL